MTSAVKISWADAPNVGQAIYNVLFSFVLFIGNILLENKLSWAIIWKMNLAYIRQGNTIKTV